MTRLILSAAALLLAASALTPVHAADIGEGSWQARHHGPHHRRGWHPHAWSGAHHYGHHHGRHPHGFHDRGVVWVAESEPYIARGLIYNTPPDPWASWTGRGRHRHSTVISARY